MWAASCFDIDFAAAIGALLCGGSSRNLLFVVADFRDFVHNLEQAEKHECHDYEVNKCGNKRRGKTRNVGTGVFGGTRYEIKQGIDEIIGKRSNNACERTADNNTNSHIHHIAFKGEFFEFLNKLFHKVSPP
jgi:hypothetical protein